MTGRSLFDMGLTFFPRLFTEFTTKASACRPFPMKKFSPVSE